jgi:hypothetical protein
MHEARRVSSGLSNPEPLFPAGPALSEHAELSMGHSEICTTDHGGQSKLTDDALTAWRRVEARYGLPVTVYRPTIVTLCRDGHAEVVVRQPVRDDIPASRGERESALSIGNGLVIRALDTEMD